MTKKKDKHNKRGRKPVGGVLLYTAVRVQSRAEADTIGTMTPTERGAALLAGRGTAQATSAEANQ